MVSENKKQKIKELVDSIHKSSLVGVVNLENLPAQQLQNMRAMLRSKGVQISTARKRILNLAIKQSHQENLEPLGDKMHGIPALLFSNDNPFSLYATIQANKSEAPAKAGQVAPKDIIIKAGPTGFAPGPIISELASVGIKTKVESGKLSIIDNVKVAKEGDVISAKLAETLKRLDVKPMEVGLHLIAAWEKGHIFAAKDLRIDKDEYLQRFTSAAQWAINLAVEAAIPASETTELLVQKAFNDAKALSLDQNILTDATAEEILAKVERQAISLKDTAGLSL